MNGQVDDLLRALIDVKVSNSPSGDANAITAWIDTAFNGQCLLHGVVWHIDRGASGRKRWQVAANWDRVTCEPNSAYRLRESATVAGLIFLVPLRPPGAALRERPTHRQRLTTIAVTGSATSSSSWPPCSGSKSASMPNFPLSSKSCVSDGLLMIF